MPRKDPTANAAIANILREERAKRRRRGGKRRKKRIATTWTASPAEVRRFLALIAYLWGCYARIVLDIRP